MKYRQRPESSQGIFRITQRKEMKNQTVYSKLYDERNQHIMHPLGRFPANIISSDKALGDSNQYFDLDTWAKSKGIPLETEQWVLDRVEEIEAKRNE